MKKFFALFLAVVMAFSMAACAAPAEEPAVEEAAPAEEVEAAPAEGGSVYYLNFKPEADAAWQELAALYTEQTGVEVKVVTAASGTYSDTLTAEMAKSEAPTLFQCGNAQGLLDWGEYCLDLTGTAFANELTTNDFNLYDEAGALKAVGYCYEAFGIIVNKALLAQAGYAVEDIKDFASLKAVAEDIHARSAELGFDAFSAAGLEGSSSWRFSGHLANMPLYYEFAKNGVTEQPATITGEYMDLFKNIWDLYINNSAADPKTLSTGTGEQSTGEFKEGKAVFYQNGTWEFAGLVEAGMNPADLTMIPIYCGAEGEEKAGLCCGTENCWAVNAKASEADIQATLDFMAWCVTSEEGTNAMANEMGFVIPFKAAVESPNLFVKQDVAYSAAGKNPVSWNFPTMPSEEWKNGVGSALSAYAADQTDANWDAVVTAFVDGWAYEYSLK